MKNIILVLITIALSACSYAPQRYSISASNSMALKSIGNASINLNPFTKSADFNSDCRGTLSISAPDNMSFEGYIQKGLEEELKSAGMFNDKSPYVTLSGDVEQLSFGSMRSLSGGTWEIGLRVKSSNGKSIYVAEHYEFDAGFGGFAACQKVADYYMQATQNVIGKLIASPDFKSLIAPTNQTLLKNDSPSNFAASKSTTNTTSQTKMLPNQSVSQKLRELQLLKKDGIITEDEFQEKKKQLLEQM